MGQDVDDEEFLEIAIAMSLQDQDAAGAGNPIDNVIVNLQALRGRALQRLQSLDAPGGGAVGGPSGQPNEQYPYVQYIIFNLRMELTQYILFQRRCSIGSGIR